MSINAQIKRIKKDKNDIKAAIVEMGVNVGKEKIDAYPRFINLINGKSYKGNLTDVTLKPEIQRITEARDRMLAVLESKGLTISADMGLDNVAEMIRKLKRSECRVQLKGIKCSAGNAFQPNNILNGISTDDFGMIKIPGAKSGKDQILTFTLERPVLPSDKKIVGVKVLFKTENLPQPTIKTVITWSGGSWESEEKRFTGNITEVSHYADNIDLNTFGLKFVCSVEKTYPNDVYAYFFGVELYYILQ